MPDPIATAGIERNLDLACAVGALGRYERGAIPRRGRARRWLLVTPTGDEIEYGPTGAEAFGLGVRFAVEATS